MTDNKTLNETYKEIITEDMGTVEAIIRAGLSGIIIWYFQTHPEFTDNVQKWFATKKNNYISLKTMHHLKQNIYHNALKKYPGKMKEINLAMNDINYQIENKNIKNVTDLLVFLQELKNDYLKGV